jgi:predicted ferric reductase
LLVVTLFLFIIFLVLAVSSNQLHGESQGTGVHSVEYWKLFGNIGMVCMMFLMFPVARHSIWLAWFGVSFEGLLKYHRGLGVLCLGLLAAHGVGKGSFRTFHRVVVSNAHAGFIVSFGTSTSPRRVRPDASLLGGQLAQAVRPATRARALDVEGNAAPALALCVCEGVCVGVGV